MEVRVPEPEPMEEPKESSKHVRIAEKIARRKKMMFAAKSYKKAVNKRRKRNKVAKKARRANRCGS